MPDHWMNKFFVAAGFMELLLFEDAMGLYSLMVQQGLGQSPYVVSQIALAHYHLSCKSHQLSCKSHLLSCKSHLLSVTPA